MNKKAIDSEVLRILIGVLKNQINLTDAEADDRWRDDAQFYLNIIGEAFIDVTEILEKYCLLVSFAMISDLS